MATVYRSKYHPSETAGIEPVKAQRPVTYSKKEMFQPHLPVRLPCYDLAPVTDFALGSSLR